MSEHCLIIGAGQAGLSVAQALRERRFAGKITLVGNENTLPYQRPPLSKKFLSSPMEVERLWLKPPAFFDVNAIQFLPHTPIRSVDPAARLAFHDHGQLAYTRLILATGTKARRLHIDGADLPNIHTLRTVQDVLALRPHMQAGQRLVILGAGYVGLEVAAVARTLGLDVRVIEAADRVLARVVSPQISDFFETLHKHHGVYIQTQTRVQRIVKAVSSQDAPLTLLTDQGEQIKADLVLIAVGAQAQTELADSIGVSVEDGIVVSGGALTSHPDIYAIGDCSRFMSARYGRSLRLESVQNAVDQARAAAAQIMGEHVSYDPVPWFWSDQYDVKLQIVGLSQGFDRVILRGDPRTNAFSALYLRQNHLLAVDSVQRPRDHMRARQLIGHQFTGGCADELPIEPDLGQFFAN